MPPCRGVRGCRRPLERCHDAHVTPRSIFSFLPQEDRCTQNCYGPLPRPDIKIFSVRVDHDGSQGSAPTIIRYGSHVLEGGSAQC
jgi:hypothetical protein